MQSVWFRPEHHKDIEKKKNFEASIRNSRILADRFLEIITGIEESLDRKEFNLDDYTDAWVFKQAHVNGQRAILNRMKELFSFVNEKATTVAK